MKFQVWYLGLFCRSTVIDSNSIQSMLEFLKGLFLVLQVSYYTLMIILMKLSVILISTLMMLFSTLSVIKPLAFHYNQNWLLNLNLNYETLQTEARRGLLIGALILSPTVLICFMKILYPEFTFYLYKSTIHPCMEYFWQVLLAATQICFMNYRNRSLGLFVFHLLSLLNAWLIVKM